jgi:hypothetical protein
MPTLEELLLKLKEGRLTCEEAPELRRLLEERRRKHEESGDLRAALLALTILMLLLSYCVRKGCAV